LHCLQAAAILLPILIVQDAISIYVCRRDRSGWNLKVLLVGSVFGIGIAWALAAQVSDAFVRLVVGAIGVSFVLYIGLRGRRRSRGRSLTAWPGT
jgi:uncharacterized membrane protein YfcA